LLLDEALVFAPKGKQFRSIYSTKASRFPDFGTAFFRSHGLSIPLETENGERSVDGDKESVGCEVPAGASGMAVGESSAGEGVLGGGQAGSAGR